MPAVSCSPFGCPIYHETTAAWKRAAGLIHREPERNGFDLTARRQAGNGYAIAEPENLADIPICKERRAAGLLLPWFQRQGIGTEVLLAVLQRADADGLPVRLEYLKGNPVGSLYKRHGFAVVAENGSHYFLVRPPRKI